MDKIIKKIISVILYLFLMYISYNVFLPENGFLSKNEQFLKKQENIIKFEKLVERSKSYRDIDKFHISEEVSSDERRIRLACEGCHTDYPHKKNRITRAFFNMHSFKLSCLTCHIDKNDRKKVKFGWFDSDANFKKDGIELKNTRITPYLVLDSYETAVERGIKDHDHLKRAYKLNVSLGKDVTCKSCHIKKGKLLLNLSSLGYTKDKIKILRTLDEATMYNRKNKWNYPDFL
jgi:hypothetical protein